MNNNPPPYGIIGITAWKSSIITSLIVIFARDVGSSPTAEDLITKNMNPNSICVAENEVLRARLKRNKELAMDILVMIQSPSLMDTRKIYEKLNEIIKGK